MVINVTNLQIRNMVLQQGLGVADVFFSPNEHKGNHTLLSHKGTTNNLVKVKEKSTLKQRPALGKMRLKQISNTTNGHVLHVERDDDRGKERSGVGWGSHSSGRRADRSIHLFAAGSVVPACPLPAYLLSGKLFVVVSLDSNTHHARFVHNLLDDFPTLADDFA